MYKGVVKKPLIVFCLLLAFIGAAPSDVDKLQKELANMKSVEASFVQTIFSARFGDENAHGSMVIQKPNKMRWLYQKPQARVFMADGKTFFRFDAVDGVEHQTPQEKLMDGSTSFSFLWEDVALQKNYKIQTQPKEGNRTRFILTPIKKDADLQEIQLEASFHPFTIYQIQTLDQMQQKNLLVFDQVKINRKLSKETFDYEVVKSAIIQENQKLQKEKSKPKAKK